MELRIEGGLCDEAVRRGTERENESAAAPSLWTDVSLRLIFPLRVYPSALFPCSPGDFMPPEQPEKSPLFF